MGKQTMLALAHVVALTLALAHAPLRAQSEPEEGTVARAEAIAAEAFEAYSRRDYPRAIALYRQALDASPSADILYNLARIYDTKQKNRQLAIEYYERYRNDSDAEPDRVQIANERLAVLRELERLADEPAARSPAASSGPSAEATGPLPASATSQRSEGLSSGQLVGIFIGAAGVAGLGLGAGFGLAANSDADIAHDLCDGNACTSERGVDAARDAARAATISTVSFIAGGALVAAGLTLLILASDAPEERHARLQLEPYASARHLGAQLAGSW
jgi:tetratricopeptide (TPR) repeat protein